MYCLTLNYLNKFKIMQNVCNKIKINNIYKKDKTKAMRKYYLEPVIKSILQKKKISGIGKPLKESQKKIRREGLDGKVRGL